MAEVLDILENTVVSKESKEASGSFEGAQALAHLLAKSSTSDVRMTHPFAPV